MERLVIEWNNFVSQMRALAARMGDVSLALPQGRTALTVLISLILLAVMLTWQNTAHQGEVAAQAGVIKDLQAQIVVLQDNVATLGTEKNTLTTENIRLKAENSQQGATIAQQASSLEQMKKQVPPSASDHDAFLDFLKGLFAQALALIGKDFIWEILKDIARFLGFPVP